MTTERDFPIHDADSAPAASQARLEQTRQQMGMIPNLLGVMAESPQLLEAYQTLFGLFQQSSLSSTEQHAVLLAASAENGCDYCVPAHSAMASQAGVDESTIEALRRRDDVADDRLQALVRFVRTLIQKRGEIEAEALNQFLEAGYTRQQALDVVLGLATKVISNYTNGVAAAPLDEAMQGFASSADEAASTA